MRRATAPRLGESIEARAPQRSSAKSVSAVGRNINGDNTYGLFGRHSMRLETYQRILEWIREGEQEARVLLFKKLRLLPIHEPKRTRTRQRNRSRR
jgi:hypothetical protein